MRGGDYISTTSTISGVPADISQSSLTKILSVAQLSSVAEFSRLTVDQIGALINSIDGQITTNSQRISQLTSEIGTLENSITRLPDGLQLTFDTADFVYTSTETEFKRVSSNYIVAGNSLSTSRGELSTLLVSRDTLGSSLTGYRENYSSVLSSYTTNKEILDGESASYSSLVGEYLVKSTNYIVAYETYQESLTKIGELEETVSTLSSAYRVANTGYDIALQSFRNYSTISIPEAQFIAASTLSSYTLLTTRKANLLSTINGASTAMQLAEAQLAAAEANRLYSNSLATETLFSNQILSLGNSYNLETDPGQRTVLSSLIQSTTLQYGSARWSTLYYQSNLSSLLSSSYMTMIQIAERNISTAFDSWQQAQANERRVLSTISGLTISIDNSYPTERGLRSTLSSLSTTYLTELSSKQGYFKEMSSLTQTESVLSSLLRSTLQNITSYIRLSTLWGQSTIEFQSTFTYWSSVVKNSQSSIDGYSGERTIVNGQITTLDNEISVINQSISSEFGRLDVNAQDFYSKKRTELLAEVDEFRYAAREYNAYIGALTAECLIQKLNLFDEVDLLTFQIQSTITANDVATKGILEIKRINILTDQNTLQNIVNTINPLEVTFNTLDTRFQEERQLKNDFITIRNTIHGYERRALSSPTISTTFKTEYLTEWSDLETNVTGVNLKIDARNTLLDNITGTIGQERTSRLDSMMAKYTGAFTSFPPVANYVYSRTRLPVQSRTLPMDAIYALMPPIPYL